jgi:5-methylcytosine-specific restriction enzyme subunit McrC
LIPIKNLYFILCYSWGRLDEGALVDVSVDEIKAPQDLLARVLINGANRLLKEGLDRGYIEELEETASLRGKIDFSASIRKMLFHQGKAAVIVDVNRYQYPRHLPTSLGTAAQIVPEKAHRCNYGA